MKLFKPSDFPRLISTPEQIAEQANKILEERGMRVLGNELDLPWVRTACKATHQALLLCIEELPKKPCEHEPKLDMKWGTESRMYDERCKHCGVKLKAKWEAE